MVTVPDRSALRNHSTRYGVATVAAGVVLLVALRVWASPLVRRMQGRPPNGLFEFLLIPVFLGVVGIGILLFLWEPEPHPDGSR